MTQDQLNADKHETNVLSPKVQFGILRHLDNHYKTVLMWKRGT